jgi:acetylornithine deacetylase/succinyl-diaminopimelate desuccinylase-like protein
MLSRKVTGVMGHRSLQSVVRGRRIYGRGSNDNCQELVSSVYAAAALKDWI